MLKDNDEDIFSADTSPEMKQELLALNMQINSLPVYFRAEIVISYLKNHCIKNEWIKANPELVGFLLSGNFTSGHTEALFNFCRLKPGYRLGYENYIKKTLLN